jgi:ABC-type glycerol-3-phosphate transport system substrate-binding protein
LTAAAAVAAAALVAGCTTTTQAPTTESTGPADLVYWNTGSDDEALVVQAAADLYTQKNPNVKIKVQAISWDDGHAKTLAAASSRTGPDLISGGLSWGIEFGALGGMIDLRQQGIESLKPQIQPGVWKSIVSPDGGVFGVPLDMTAYVFFYRTDLMEQAGLSGPPKTWDELTAAIDKLKGAGKRAPFAMTWGTLGWLQYFNYLKQAGGSLYAADCGKATIDSDQAVRALTFWADLHRKYGVPNQEPDLPVGLAKGDIVMASGGSWNINAFDTSQPTLKGKWATAALPTGPQGPGSFIGGRIIGVMSYTKYPTQAADFVKFLYTPEAIGALQKAATAKGILWLAPRSDQLTNLTATENVKSTLNETFASSEGPPNCKGWEQSQADVDKKLQSVIVNNVDPKKALTEAAEIMNNNLRK